MALSGRLAAPARSGQRILNFERGTISKQASPLNVGKGAEVELFVEKLAFGGKALGKLDGLVVFVDHGLPGQKVRAVISRKKAQFAEARVLQVLEQSPAFVTPRCRHFGLCGGCQWQDLAYDEQLRWKQQQVRESLPPLTGSAPANAGGAHREASSPLPGAVQPPPEKSEGRASLVTAVVPSPMPFYYRNKMEFTFAPRPWLPAEALAAGQDPDTMGPALGLHVPGSFHRVFNLTECHLQSPLTGDIVTAVRQWCRDSGQPAYDTRKHTGFWRFLIVREGKRTGQLLLHLITTDQGDRQAVAALGAHLQDRFPQITTMVQAVNAKKAQVAQGKADRVLWGPGFIEEQILGRRFRISPASFFQTNTLAAEALYQTVIRMGEFSGRETVWDLYCGAGSIALCLADRVRRVVGFELADAAVQDAYVNCRLNGVDNCQFLAGDLKDCIREAMQSPHFQPPDVVITDPPRAGMHPEVIRALLDLAPPRLIAVSCNPATLARDLALLQEKYAVVKVEPHDLFPHTGHVECVVRLEKKRTALP